MEVYKYILDCTKCNHHLLFNDSDTQIERKKIGYVCEIHTKRKDAFNKIYYTAFNDLDDLIKIIRKNNKDIIKDVIESIKAIKYVICPNCGEKIILNSKTFYNTGYFVIDSYNWHPLCDGKIDDDEFLKNTL